jgi:sulfhydrogenase subunit delta
MSDATKPKVAVHKFSSCDGCQLALLNLGEGLVALSQLVDIVHFAEAGPVDEEQCVDIALVEGSISTPEDHERIQRIREQSGYLISIGACATSGGVQALRNMADAEAWVGAIYPKPEYISLLDSSTAVADQVKVDLELWGCPVNSGQVVGALRDLLSGVKPRVDVQPLCMECKRRGVICTIVAHNQPCMGPVTRAGCGALCPGLGRACYGCYGPSEQVNAASLAQHFGQFGMSKQDIRQRFGLINSNAAAFKRAADGLNNE